MPYRQISVEVNSKNVRDLIIAELVGNGCAGVWETPTTDSKIKLVLYFNSFVAAQYCIQRIEDVLERSGCSVPKIGIETKEDEDWNLEWRKKYTSFDVGSHFRVVPSWEKVSEIGERIQLSIDPGQAFGTGTHETTQMVIEALEKCQVTDKVVLDLGVGSGILSIVAMKLGWLHVIGCDLDAEALVVAKDNSKNNFVSPSLFIGTIDCVGSKSVGLLLANLDAGTIRHLFPEINRILSPGASVVLSGMLKDQVEATRSIFSETEYIVSEEQSRGEWVTLLLRYGN